MTIGIILALIWVFCVCLKLKWFIKYCNKYSEQQENTIADTILVSNKHEEHNEQQNYYKENNAQRNYLV